MQVENIHKYSMNKQIKHIRKLKIKQNGIVTYNSKQRLD